MIQIVKSTILVLGFFVVALMACSSGLQEEKKEDCTLISTSPSTPILPLGKQTKAECDKMLLLWNISLMK